MPVEFRNKIIFELGYFVGDSKDFVIRNDVKYHSEEEKQMTLSRIRNNNPYDSPSDVVFIPLLWEGKTIESYLRAECHYVGIPCHVEQ